METQRVMLSLLPLTKWPLPFSTGPRTLSMGAPSQSATGCHQNRAASEGKAQPRPQADLVFEYLLLRELWCSGSHQPPHLPRPSGAPRGWPAGTSAFAGETLSAPRHDLGSFPHATGAVTPCRAAQVPLLPLPVPIQQEVLAALPPAPGLHPPVTPAPSPRLQQRSCLPNGLLRPVLSLVLRNAH